MYKNLAAFLVLGVLASGCSSSGNEAVSSGAFSFVSEGADTPELVVRMLLESTAENDQDKILDATIPTSAVNLWDLRMQ